MAGNLGDSKERISINLYPMLDIFSLLICFLLMNFSTQGESVEANKNLELPISGVKLNLDTAASVSVTKSEIVLQGGSVSIPIQTNGDIAENEKVQGGIKKIYEELKKIRANNETVKNKGGVMGVDISELETLTLEADKNTNFLLIKRLILTAQQAEFVRWKLAVARNSID